MFISLFPHSSRLIPRAQRHWHEKKNAWCKEHGETKNGRSRGVYYSLICYAERLPQSASFRRYRPAADFAPITPQTQRPTTNDRLARPCFLTPQASGLTPGAQRSGLLLRD